MVTLHTILSMLQCLKCTHAQHWPAYGRPSWRHTTRASSVLQAGLLGSSQMVPQYPSLQTSTRPSFELDPPTRRAPFILHGPLHCTPASSKWKQVKGDGGEGVLQLSMWVSLTPQSKLYHTIEPVPWPKKALLNARAPAVCVCMKVWHCQVIGTIVKFKYCTLGKIVCLNHLYNVH